MSSIIKSGFVYFIYSKDEILYVGKTNNILDRLRSHGVLYRTWVDNKNYVYKFRDDIIDRIEFIECEDKLSSTEEKFIGFLKPKYNVQCKNKSYKVNLKEYEFKKFNIDENYIVKYYSSTKLEIENRSEYIKVYNNIIAYDTYEWFKYKVNSVFNILDSLLRLIENVDLWKTEQKDVMYTLNVLKKYGLIEMNNTAFNVISIKIIHHIKYQNNKPQVEKVIEDKNQIEPPFVTDDEGISSIDFINIGDILDHKMFREGIVVDKKNNICYINFKMVGIKKILISNLSKPILKFKKINKEID